MANSIDEILDEVIEEEIHFLPTDPDDSADTAAPVLSTSGRLVSTIAYIGRLVAVLASLPGRLLQGLFMQRRTTDFRRHGARSTSALALLNSASSASQSVSHTLQHSARELGSDVDSATRSTLSILQEYAEVTGSKLQKSVLACFQRLSEIEVAEYLEWLHWVATMLREILDDLIVLYNNTSRSRFIHRG